MTKVRKLTGGAGPAIAHCVQRLLGLFAVLALLVSVGMSPIAHANEQLCLPESQAAATPSGHVDGDIDQTPDAEKGVPHHHGGCHGHHFAASGAGSETEASLIKRARFFANRSALLTSAPLDRSLRPPIA